MAKLDINIGASANDKSGDTLRVAFNKINLNFIELYALTGGSIAALTELAQDYAAPLLNHANHTNITATYNDANNKILLTGTPAQVQSDWNASSGLGVILNKPTIPTDINQLADGSNLLSGGLSISDFGEGFSLTDSDKIVTNKLYSTNLTQPTQHYRLELDTNGVVRLPDGSIINGSTIRGVAGTSELNYTGITIGPNSNDAEKTWMWVDHANAYISTNNSANTWTFGTDGTLTLPGTGTITNASEVVAPVGALYTFSTNYAGSTPGLNASHNIVLADNANSQEIQAGWIITFANSTTKEVTTVSSGVDGYTVNWSGDLALSPSDVWPLTVQSADYSAGTTTKSLEITPDGTTTWTFGDDGRTTFPFNMLATDSQLIIQSDGETEIRNLSETNGIDIVTNITNGDTRWSFGIDSTLTLPAPLAQLTNTNQLDSDTAKIYRATNSTDAEAIQSAWNTWYGDEWVFRTYVQEDESSRGSNFPWHGMPSWEAYPLILNWNGVGLPPSSSMAPAAVAAINAYLAYKELVSSIDIVNGNKTISFDNTGLLSLPGKLEFKDTANAKIILKTIDPYGYVVEDSEQDKTWTFNTNGSLTFPDSTVQTTAFTGTATPNNITNTAGAGGSATIVVGGTLMTKNELSIRVTNNTNTLDVEINYSNPDGQRLVSVYRSYPSGANLYSGRTLKAANNTTWDLVGNLPVEGDSLSFTVTDHSFLKVYRVTVVADVMPGVTAAGEVFCIIEALK